MRIQTRDVCDATSQVIVDPALAAPSGMASSTVPARTTKLYEGKIKSVIVPDLELRDVDGALEFRGYASRPSVDRYNEIVQPKAFVGALETYARNPVMLYQHDPDRPVGTFPVLDLRANGLFVTGRIGHSTTAADEARALVRQRIIRAMSIGFLETAPGDVDEDGRYNITGLDLLEISLVSVPACNDALFEIDGGGQLRSVHLLDTPSQRFSDQQLVQLCRARGLSVSVPAGMPGAAPRTALPAADAELQARGAVPYVKYPIQDVDAAWDARAARTALKTWATTDDGTVDLRRFAAGFTYVRDGATDLAAYRIPHHTVEDGALVTNARGCRSGVAALFQDDARADLSDAEHRSAYVHLAAHLQDDFSLAVPPYEEARSMTTQELYARMGVAAQEAPTKQAGAGEATGSDGQPVLHVLAGLRDGMIALNEEIESCKAEVTSLRQSITTLTGLSETVNDLRDAVDALIEDQTAEIEAASNAA